MTPTKIIRRGLATTGACFVLLMVLAVTRPFGVLDHEAPMTTGRRATAGVMLLLNLGLYTGLVLTLVGVVRWFRSRRET